MPNPGELAVSPRCCGGAEIGPAGAKTDPKPSTHLLVSREPVKRDPGAGLPESIDGTLKSGGHRPSDFIKRGVGVWRSHRRQEWRERTEQPKPTRAERIAAQDGNCQTHDDGLRCRRGGRIPHRRYPVRIHPERILGTRRAAGKFPRDSRGYRPSGCPSALDRPYVGIGVSTSPRATEAKIAWAEAAGAGRPLQLRCGRTERPSGAVHARITEAPSQLSGRVIDNLA